MTDDGTAYATPYLVDSGPGDAGLGAKVFFIWGTCCFVCIIFVYTMIYETKGLSLEQVDELYFKVNRAWNSPGFTPTVNFQEVREAGVDARRMTLAEAEDIAVRRKSSVAYQEGDRGATAEKV